jgi:hypothetical protein
MDMICSENGAGISVDCDAFSNFSQSVPIDHVKSLPYSRLGQVEGVLAGSAIAKPGWLNRDNETGMPKQGSCDRLLGSYCP